ncbi:hypothetical protein EVD33_14980 [Bacteroidales bacterium SW292]|nr:hypothetical protein [Bacteroidales bacterium SW292]
MYHLRQQAMTNEELEKEIEKKKKDISDYLAIVKLLNVTKEEKERQLNIMLDDLSKLMEQKKK